MMKRSFFLLFALCLCGIPAKAQLLNAPDISRSISHTYTTHTLELEPASFIDMQNSYQTAAICFLGSNCDDKASFNKGEENYSLNTEEQCTNEGYAKSTCNEAQEMTHVCPYNSNYGTGCKCKPNLVTCNSTQKGVGPACGGKYVSCSCNPEFQYNASNCSSPRSPTGTSCGGSYNTCSCPKGVSAGAYGCKEYYASPCGSVCKTANTDNCHKRTAVAAPYGCMNYFADCSSKCEKAYTDNCRSRTDIPAPYGCKTLWSDCSTKCQTPNTDNCHNRTAVTANFGCQTYYADCTSKCQTAYTDGCHNRTAVATPYGCKTYFADCKSKCQTAYTDNCHNRVGQPAPHGCVHYWADCKSKCQIAFIPNPCDSLTAVPAPYGCKKYFDECSYKCEEAYPDNCQNRTSVSAPLGCAKYFEDCPTKCQIAWKTCDIVDFIYVNKKCTDEYVPEQTPIGIIFNKSERLMLALENKSLIWSNQDVDIPGMTNIGTDLSNIYSGGSYVIRGYTTAQISKDADGKRNTKLLVDYGKSKGISFPAAEYAYNYSTPGTNKGDWWLPSAAEFQKVGNKMIEINNKLVRAVNVSAGGDNWTSNVAHKIYAVDSGYVMSAQDQNYGKTYQQFRSKTSGKYSHPMTKY